jgi:hypothetical protein
MCWSRIELEHCSGQRKRCRIPRRTALFGNQVPEAPGLDAVKIADVAVQQRPARFPQLIERANALLAAGDAQKVLVDRLPPVPIHSGSREGLIERLPVQLFGLGERAIDIEDERARLIEQAPQLLDARGHR